MPRPVRWLAYAWAAPVSLAGLVLSLAATYRGAIRLVDGVVEVHGPLLAWALRRLVPLRGGAAAITFGHVVLARDQAALDATRVHERVHVRQCERWGPFERDAFRAE